MDISVFVFNQKKAKKMDISRLCKNQKATRKAKVYMPISIKFFDAAAIICYLLIITITKKKI